MNHYASAPIVGGAVLATVLTFLVVGAVMGFPRAWIIAFEVSIASITLVMLFLIQHTQQREQATTQRKLDELLRALPGADESLMMLEEAPAAFILGVEESQREVRADLVDAPWSEDFDDLEP